MPKKSKKKTIIEEDKTNYNIIPPHISITEFEMKESPFLSLNNINLLNDWCNIEFRLLNWTFMNFMKLRRVNTSITQISHIIEEHHVKVADLRIFLSPPSLKTEIKDFNLLLSDLGFHGNNKNTPEKIILFYDFKSSCNDPLLEFSKLDSKMSI